LSLQKRRKARTKKSRRRVKIAVFVVGGLTTLILALVFSIFVFSALALRDVPDLNKAEAKFKHAETSKIFDVNGDLITNMYFEQNRVNVPISGISTYLQDAVVAIEDERFYEHEGVDLKAIARAFYKDVQQGRIAEGGSTITQQYVKNTFLSPEKMLTRKTKEAALAYELEKKYSKKEILEGYLNTVYFGQSAYGVETASQTYFGKNAKDVTLAESALLAGVIQTPNANNPYVDPNRALARRNKVISNMLEQGKINSAEAKAATKTPIEIKPIDLVGSSRHPYFVDFVKQKILTDSRYGETEADRANALYKGGLRIYTTIDPKLQQYAEEAVWGTLDRPGDPSGSLVSIEPETGYIKAMVGGKDYKTSKLNLATQGKRQPGSSFKPFVLASAIEDGVSVNQSYNSSPGTFKVPGSTPWKVKNSSGKGAGTMTLRHATTFSVNAVFARLILDIGPDKVVELVKKMGIKTEINAFPAIALGAEEVTVLDMATAYSTFANNGSHARPIAIMKVTDAKGNVLVENAPKADPAINPVTAFLVTDVLQGVIRGGTGTRANIGRPAAGKTGTTENNGDAWFVGYTPDLSSAVWVGHPDSRKSMTNVHGRVVYGGTFPAEIWRKFMSKALKDVKASSFKKPKGGLSYIKVDTTDGIDMLANEFCPEEAVKYMMIAKGTSPNLPECDRHNAPPSVKVPNVVGKSLDVAKQTLTDLGFDVSINYSPSSFVPKGQVVAQSPSEGSEIAQGSGVEIAVSSGPAKIVLEEIPDVVGKTEEKAKEMLNPTFIVEVIYVTPADPDMDGKVISQSPVGDSQAESGSEVTITVGKL